MRLPSAKPESPATIIARPRHSLLEGAGNRSRGLAGSWKDRSPFARERSMWDKMWYGQNPHQAKSLILQRFSENSGGGEGAGCELSGRGGEKPLV